MTDQLNELVKDGFLAIPDDNSAYICPVCNKRHIRPWQARANSFFNRRPVNMHEARHARQQIKALENVTDETRQSLTDAFQEFGLAVHDAKAIALEIHEAGGITWEQYRAVTEGIAA